MLKTQDIITCIVPTEHTSLIINNAKLAEIGGISQIRSKKQRSTNLAEDQLVGQIANYCASMILTGSPEGYIEAREKANKNPTQGDGGVDIIGLPNIDIKGSLMRYSSDPLNYRLLVRPRERHNNWIYVLGLVPKERPYKCHMVGWAKDQDLPSAPYNGSIKSLHGAYVVESCMLRNIKDLINNV